VVHQSQHTGRSRLFDHARRLFRVHRHWLFAKHCFALLECGESNLHVSCRWRDDAYKIDVAMCRDGDDPEIVARTSGRAIDGVEVRTAEDTGEILVRGYNVMSGYFEDDAATAQAVDGDGWLHTGDVGELDEAGNLRITDRIKDMFICGGFNAYPAEIEQVLLAFPGVQEAAVVGVPDQRLGEVGKAFVIAVPGQRIEPEALIAYAEERLANYKVPRHVELVEAFPRSSLGKVLKRELR